MSVLVIREVTPNDFDALMLLYEQLHPEDRSTNPAAVRATLDQIINSANLYLFVGVSDREVVGSVYLNVMPNLTRAATPYALIENVITRADQRGRGVGKRLMKHATDVAWKAGCYKVMLLTGSKNEATHAFYRTCGFSADEKTGYIMRPPTP